LAPLGIPTGRVGNFPPRVARVTPVASCPGRIHLFHLTWWHCHVVSPGHFSFLVMGMKDLLRVLRVIRLKRRFRELQKHGFYRGHWKGRGGVRKKWPRGLLKVYEKLEGGE